MVNVKKARRFIFATVLALSLFGILMVYDASSVYAWKTTGDYAYFLKRQFIFLLIALVVFFFSLLPDVDVFRRYAKGSLALTVGLLILVLFVGKASGGAKRWLYFLGISLQPSELLKIAFPLYCSDYLVRKGPLIKNFKEGILPLVIMSCFVFTLLILEPDLGSVIFWGMWLFVVLFLCGAKKRHLWFIFLLGCALILILVVIAPYRLSRIVSFLNPWGDPQNRGFQVVQSQIAYGRGGIFGVGLGASRQKLFFLPAAHTDFISSIIAEEFGLIGISAVIIAFSFLIKVMFDLALRMRDTFRRNLGLGIVFLLMLEVIINLGVGCGFFPTKGLPLPFISYGGSSLVVHYLLLGVFFNLSREKSLHTII